MSAAPPQVNRGIVKQVLSGDAVVIRGQPKGGPPPEKTLCLSNITAPRLARRSNPNSAETKDEPWAWEAREFLRKKCIGKEVSFTVEYKVPGTGREYGCVYLGSDTNGENLTENLISQGLVEVRRGGIKPGDEGQQKLLVLEDTAKAAKCGKWSDDDKVSEHVRDIKWTSDEPRKLVDSQHNKPLNAVIEHVRDGCTVRAFLLPSFQYVTVMLSGVKAPMVKADGQAEPYALEAQFFVESRLLQRDVQIVLEGVSNQNFLGTVLHPNGNITEMLLKEGFARCVDWSMGVVSQGTEKYRAAEKSAKERKVRIWKDYTPSASQASMENIKEKQFQAKVMEVVNGDALVVKVGNDTKKIFLSSIRPPRQQAVADDEADPRKKIRERSRPLYDVPYMFEAREFLRKKLIGKKVQVKVDYVQPASNNYPEKVCCTVSISNSNVAETLISKGFATVVRYRQDDDSRSSHYDELLAAEARAIKKMVGVHSKAEPPIHRIADMTGGESAKAKQFLPFLTRMDKCEAVVEYVASGSRLRLYIPRETCLMTFLVNGIQCPRGPRPAPGPGNQMLPGEPYGEEALAHTKELCLQREVEIKVQNCDKAGNFIGWLFVDNQNLSVSLVENGLAKCHYSAQGSVYERQLEIAEASARQAKLGLWKDFVEEIKEAVQDVEDSTTERKTKVERVIVTDVNSADLSFSVQKVEHGNQLEKFMNDFRSELESNPPLPGAYTPKKGDLCAATFADDGLWYRARIEKVDKDKGVSVLYIDFGNRDIVPSTKVAPLPAAFASLPSQAKEYKLAFVKLPEDEDFKAEALDVFYHNVANKALSLNFEYKSPNGEHASLFYDDSGKDDVAQGMLEDGFLLTEPRRERRFAKLMSEYNAALQLAKKNRVNLWQYGDITEDDAKEFGYQR